MAFVVEGAFSGQYERENGMTATMSILPIFEKILGFFLLL